MEKLTYEVNDFYDKEQITDLDICDMFEPTRCNGGLTPMFSGICAIKNGSIADQSFVYICEHPPIHSTEESTWGGKVYKVLKTTLHEAMRTCGSFELDECAEVVPLFDLDDEGERIYDRNKFFVFDNSEYGDRYTVVFTNRFYPGHLNEPMRYEALASSENPFHPHGIGLHVEAHLDLGCEHLGMLVEFDTLSEAVKQFINDNLETEAGE